MQAIDRKFVPQNAHGLSDRGWSARPVVVECKIGPCPVNARFPMRQRPSIQDPQLA
jgi:hypothetical protein